MVQIDIAVVLAQALCQLANEHLLDQGYSLTHTKHSTSLKTSFNYSVDYFVIYTFSTYSLPPNLASDLLHGYARTHSSSSAPSSENTKKLPHSEAS